MTTYEILVSEINFFRRKYVWTTVIVDEGHRLKNEKSQLSEKLRIVPCLSKIILTGTATHSFTRYGLGAVVDARDVSGTPLQNNLKELWAMLYYLAPEIFTSSKPFEDGFDLVRGVIDAGILRRARKLLSIFMLRRVKDQVDVRLPNRKELTILVPLTEEQKKLYRQLLCGLGQEVIDAVMHGEPADASAPADLESDSKEEDVLPTDPQPHSFSRSSSNGNGCGSEPAAPNPSDSEWRLLMNLLLQLRKVCNHTYLMPDIAPEPYQITGTTLSSPSSPSPSHPRLILLHIAEEIVSGSGKLMIMDRILPRLQKDGHRVLIFSQFTSMLDILEDYCELRDYSFVRLDGSTNRVKRRLDVRRFNATNSPLFIFLISTRAGGLGLNLASADTVILYDSDW